MKLQTETSLQKSFVAGVERVAAWAYLLDSINVFPIADGDTGRNLSISLTPLRNSGSPKERVVHQLLLSARGNSGNIASRFFPLFILRKLSLIWQRAPKKVMPGHGRQ